MERAVAGTVVKNFRIALDAYARKLWKIADHASRALRKSMNIELAVERLAKMMGEKISEITPTLYED